MMINPQSLTLKTAYDPYLTCHGFLIMNINEGYEETDETHMTHKNLWFVIDHEHYEIWVFCVGWNEIEAARKRLIERLYNSKKVFRVSVICDLITQEECQKIVESREYA